MDIWGSPGNLEVYKSRWGSPAVVPPDGDPCICQPWSDYYGACNDCYIEKKRTITFSGLSWYTCQRSVYLPSRYVKVVSVSFPSVWDLYKTDAYDFGWQATSGSATFELYVGAGCTGLKTNTYTNVAFRTTLFAYPYDATHIDWDVTVTLVGSFSNPGFIFYDPGQTQQWLGDGRLCNKDFPTSALISNWNQCYLCPSGATATLS